MLVGEAAAVPEVWQGMSDVFELMTQLGLQCRRYRFLAKASRCLLSLTQGDQLLFPSSLQFASNQAIFRLDALIPALSQVGFVGCPPDLLFPMALDLGLLLLLSGQQGLQGIQLSGLDGGEEAPYHKILDGGAVQRRTCWLSELFGQTVTDIVDRAHDMPALATGDQPLKKGSSLTWSPPRPPGAFIIA